MLNVSRPRLAASALLCLTSCVAAITARAQAVPETMLQRQISRLDLGVTAIGQLTGKVTGTNYINQPVTLKASTTVGILVNLRYIKSPLVGIEANYAQARYTENFSNTLPGGAQTKASEYSFGYVVHTPGAFFGLRPFGALGAGSMAFRPTAGGGQGLPNQARMVYYYNVGVDDDSLFSKHFGLRLHLRQAFFKAPDFGQNYLTIQKRTSTLEPGVGFYIKF